MSDFRNLIAWKKAMDLVDAIYAVTSKFPGSELYGLASQMKKAANAIPSDIAEAKGRYTIPDQRHLYREARGSAQELETQIEIAMRQKFVPQERGAMLIAQTQEVCRLINGLIGSLEKGPGARG
jgi:four helix bundle protein